MQGKDLLYGGLFEKRGRRCPERALRELEESLGVRLPADYRAFQAEGDGAVFDTGNEIEGSRRDGLEGVLLRGLWLVYPIQPQEALAVRIPEIQNNTLGYLRRTYAERVPPEFLPIIDDSGGDLYCLGISGEHRGEIFYWDHEAEAEDGDPPTMQNMDFVAASFDELLARTRLGEVDIPSWMH